jgi:hypothetical protein
MKKMITTTHSFVTLERERNLSSLWAYMILVLFDMILTCKEKS